MSKKDILRTVKKHIERVDNPKRINLCKDWYNQIKSMLKGGKIYGVEVRDFKGSQSVSMKIEV